jgi:hypothetical protein
MGTPELVSGYGADCKSKKSGGTDDMVAALARTPRTGTRFDSNSSPSRLLQPRRPFAVKRTNVGRWFNNPHFMPTSLSLISDPSAHLTVPFRRSHGLRSTHTHHCPVTMIEGFPPPTAGGGAEPGVQIGEPPPPLPAASGVQISPRVAATPSSSPRLIRRRNTADVAS